MKCQFICPKCGEAFFLPKCSKCGNSVLQINGIYQLCNDNNIKTEGDNKYIGYDDIGENFEPAVTYWDINNTERYGVYEACGDLIAEKFGKDIVVLDLGAGLGTASIPLAKNGIETIAIDISNVMLSTAAKRAKGKYENLVLAKMNAYNIMLPDKSVDIVVENSMLHLVDNPEAVIKEIVRVLKPNGKFIKYSSFSKPLSKEEQDKNLFCNEVLSDIKGAYYRFLDSEGGKIIFFDNKHQDIISKYFEKRSIEIAAGFTEIFTDKLKFALHRYRTGAYSDLQTVSKDILNKVWECTNNYAIDKYGNNYADIKGFSRYGACIHVYSLL